MTKLIVAVRNCAKADHIHNRWSKDYLPSWAKGSDTSAAVHVDPCNAASKGRCSHIFKFSVEASILPKICGRENIWQGALQTHDCQPMMFRGGQRSKDNLAAGL
jgi:hypothetical protein